MVLNHVKPCLCRQEPSNPVGSKHTDMERGELQRMKETALAAMIHLGPLARLACKHILSNIAVLPNQEGQMADQRPCCGPAEINA
jgi:hypothetical protein